MFRLVVAAAGVLATATPAMAQNSIAPGQAVSGRLERGDRVTTGWAGGSFYDCFRVAARPGQTVQVRETTNGALILAIGTSETACPERVSNAEVSAIPPREVVQTIGDSGDYWVIVMTQQPEVTAPYTLRMTATGAPRATFQPTQLRLPARPVEGRLDQADPGRINRSRFDCYAVDLPAGHTLRATLSSSAFDPWLSVHADADCESRPLVSENASRRTGSNFLETPTAMVRITHRIRTSGRYFLRVHSLFPEALGAYRLEVAAGTS